MQRPIVTSIIVLLLGSIVLWAGCAAPTISVVEDVDISVVEDAESFYADVPRDPDHLYAAEMGQSENKQTAIDIAMGNAHSGIARQFESRIDK